jgi:type III secretion system low calcium response chaperone LcrH/SycD
MELRFKNEDFDADGAAAMARAVAYEGYTFKDFAGLTDEEMEAAYALAFNLASQGQLVEAEQMFAWLCGLDQYQPKYFLGLGVCRQQLKNTGKALEAFAMAGLLDASDPVPAVRAAECQLALGRLDEARDALDAARHWAGDRPEHQAVRARAAELDAYLEPRRKGDRA